MINSIADEEAVWEVRKDLRDTLLNVGLERVLRIHYFWACYKSCVPYMTFSPVLQQLRHSKWTFGFWLFPNWSKHTKFFSIPLVSKRWMFFLNPCTRILRHAFAILQKASDRPGKTYPRMPVVWINCSRSLKSGENSWNTQRLHRKLEWIFLFLPGTLLLDLSLKVEATDNYLGAHRSRKYVFAWILESLCPSVIFYSLKSIHSRQKLWKYRLTYLSGSDR